MLPLLMDLPTNHGSPGMKKPMTSMLSPLEKLSSSHAAPLWSSVAVHLPLTGKARQTRAFQCEATVKTSALAKTWARRDHDFSLRRLERALSPKIYCTLRLRSLQFLLEKMFTIKYTRGMDKRHTAKD